MSGRGRAADNAAERHPAHLDIEVDRLRERLRRHPVRARGADERAGWQAATAVVAAPQGSSAAIAFIRRTERAGDRWSGDMALPGGTREPSDPDLATTAAREAHEEVGLNLGAPVTRLPDQRGRVSRGTVASFAYVIDELPPLIPEPTEVAEALWIPLETLFSPATATSFHRNGLSFPAIDYGGRIIWGLTHRIVTSFLEAAEVAR